MDLSQGAAIVFVGAMMALCVISIIVTIGVLIYVIRFDPRSTAEIRSWREFVPSPIGSR